MGEGCDVFEIDCVEFCKILFDVVFEGKIRWGYILKEVMFGDDGRFWLCFENGIVLFGVRFVVGVDGVWSKVWWVVRNFSFLFSIYI